MLRGFWLVFTLVIVAGVSSLWYFMEGIPHDFARYGAIAIPGKETLTLPEGDVRLHFGGGVVGSGDSRSAEEAPDDLRVSITPQEGGEALPALKVPSWMFDVTVNDRGHSPFGKVDVPEAGRYVVEVAAAQPRGRLEVGAAPWNPLGSRVAGVVLLFAVLSLIFVVPQLFFGRRRRLIT